jgi:enamine deaminase RidA (YjgF/YER057c/UK114 family)
MKVDFINPVQLAAPSGFNHGVAVTGGSLLFVSGQIGWDNESRIVGDKFVDQFALALENVVAVVREAGGEPTNIVRLLIFVTDKREYLNDLKAVGAAYRQVMGRHYPAMALVEVRALVEDLAKVEIEAIAVIDRAQSSDESTETK